MALERVAFMNLPYEFPPKLSFRHFSFPSNLICRLRTRPEELNLSSPVHPSSFLVYFIAFELRRVDRGVVFEDNSSAS